MRPIELIAVAHPEPDCTDPGDDRHVRHYEREMRVHRAYTEPFSIERTENRVDTTWYVRSGSGSEYAVDLVDGTSWDTCTCPDFLSNELGTCKHIEAIRRVLHKTPSLRMKLDKLQRQARVPTLTVNASGPLALHCLGAWSALTLRSIGLEQTSEGTLRIVDSEQMHFGTLRSGERVTCAAKSTARILHEREWRRRRALTVRSALERGEVSVDVLKRELFPYQREGAAHLLAQGRAMLADDMGLGKTVQCLAACEALRRRGEASVIVVVTSATLKDQWAREIERYTGASASVVGGGAQARREAIESDTPYKVLNYELTWRELSLLQHIEADVLVLDEAQRAKNFRTRTAATLRSIPSRYLFVLTGTPIENRLDDLYSLLQLVDPSIFGPLWRFNLDFQTLNTKGRPGGGYKNLSALRDRTAPWIMRRRKEEVLSQLPPLVEQTRYTAMTDSQARLEAGFRADAASILAIAETRSLSREEMQRAMGLLLKARQACNALELVDSKREPASPKLDEFESLVSEIVAQGNAKVLVFSEWTEMLKLAAKRLDAISTRWIMLHGGVATDRRPALIEMFKADQDLRVLLSTDAGGTGLNLQVATYVIHLDLPWNPGRLDQRTARAHRLGQTRGVQVVYLCSATGIERAIEQINQTKRMMRGAALDGTSEVETLSVQSFTKIAKEITLASLHPQNTDTAPFAALDVVNEVVVEDTAESVLEAAHEAIEEEIDIERVRVDASPTPEATQAPDVVVVSNEVTEPASQKTAPPTTDVETTAELPQTPVSPKRAAKTARANNRLKLAAVVLEAGFAGDAVRAAYEALAEAMRGMLDGDAPTHGALVAAVYRELVPTGKLPLSAHGVLATLHDLAQLEAHDMEVDPALARQAVADASEWVARLTL